jgi:uncharacterized protein (TIGR02118 family)
MYKVIFLMNKKPGLEFEEFRDYWIGTHTDIVKTIPGLLKYVQNCVQPDGEGNRYPYDGLAECWFEDEGTFSQAMATSEGQAAVADVENFGDLEKMVSFGVEEIDAI